jgi:hypothetical protein
LPVETAGKYQLHLTAALTPDSGQIIVQVDGQKAGFGGKESVIDLAVPHRTLSRVFSSSALEMTAAITRSRSGTIATPAAPSASTSSGYRNGERPAAAGIPGGRASRPLRRAQTPERRSQASPTYGTTPATYGYRIMRVFSRRQVRRSHIRLALSIAHAVGLVAAPTTATTLAIVSWVSSQPSLVVIAAAFASAALFALLAAPLCANGSRSMHHRDAAFMAGMGRWLMVLGLGLLALALMILFRFPRR